MLETTSERLSARGGPHFGSPDKLPARRLETIVAAGEERVPFTTGLLIGIGETREERIEALLAIRELADTHGHVQEVIVQNFRAKPGTRMAERSRAGARRAPLDDRGRADRARPATPICRRLRTSRTRTFRDCSTRGSTTGAASRRSRSTTSIPEAPWPELELLRGRRPRAGTSSSPRGSRSIPSGSPPSGSTRTCCRRFCAHRIRSGSRARTAGRRARTLGSRSSRATRCRSTLVQSSARRRSCGCSARGGTSATVSLPPPTSSGARSAATT